MIIKRYKTAFLTGLMACFFFQARSADVPAPLRVGYSTSITNVNAETMRDSKAAGIACIEVSFGAYVDKLTRQFTIGEDDILQQVRAAKKAADEAGIEIWSVHMPFSRKIDLSLTNKQEREQVVALHKKVLEYCRILKPKIILFHPSWHLQLNEREARKVSLIQSATELNEVVKSMGATMVIENMLGPKLLLPNGKLERPLCRSVEETLEIMDRLPNDIYSAVDMNHIKHPEQLIRALGSRVKNVHIADGDGEEERHYFPCSGKGSNDWTAILSALTDVGYTGAFIYESKPADIGDYKRCYDDMRQAYLQSQ